MKEIFAGFLTVSISGSLVICLVLLLRLLFKKVPKALICLLWALVIVRLLLPFEIPVPFSLRPDTPAFSGMDTQLFIDTELLWEEDVPDFIPQKIVKYYPLQQTSAVQIDYVAIAGLVWALVVCGLLLYALISYLRLHHRVREAVLLENNVFVGPKLGTAFLLGYFRPRIYLPDGLAPQAMQLVIAHEQTHQKRGDNWLKLIAYICLALHWFNPLVWIVYHLLCKDIEDACDEQVIRHMDTETRKAYSSALLSCGKQHGSPMVCPVAFCEISIKKRILNVLNYRKPVLWVCVVAVVAIALTATFFMTDPAVKDPPYFDQLTQLLGEPLKTVCQELEIPEDAVNKENNSTYGKTPIQVKIEGISMDLYLIDDRQGNLAGFQYVSTYVGDNTEQAAKDAVKLARSRWRSFGYGNYAGQSEDPDRLCRITEDEVTELFKNDRREHVGISELADSWDITDQSGQQVKEYLDDLEKEATWATSADGSYERKTSMRWIHSFSAWCDTKETEEDVTTVTLRYDARILPEQSENNYKDVYDENLTWWEKLVDWLI